MPTDEMTLPDAGLLADEERDRIRAEEIVRYQAREDARKLFTPKKSPAQAVRDFFNTAFGLWLLSTLVIGYGTYLFKSMQERSVRRKEADRLEIELRHRLSHFRRVVETLSKEIRETEEAGNDPWGFKFAGRLRSAYRYIQTADSAFFSTYGNDNVQALFTALQDKLRGLDEKKVVMIDSCLQELKELRKTCEDEYQNVPRPDSAETHAAYFKHVLWMVDEVLRRLEGQPLNLWSVADVADDKGQP
jgi:hypothetical protein